MDGPRFSFHCFQFLLTNIFVKVVFYHLYIIFPKKNLICTPLKVFFKGWNFYGDFFWKMGIFYQLFGIFQLKLLTILPVAHWQCDQIWRFVAILAICHHFGNLSPFWQFVTILAIFQPLWRFLFVDKIAQNKIWRLFWQFLTLIKKFKFHIYKVIF